MAVRLFVIYRVFVDDQIVYVGRTKQLLPHRIQQHFKAHHFDHATKIQFAEVETEADMNLYELYYILKWKPKLNQKDIAPDRLTRDLPELDWRDAYLPKIGVV